MNPLSAVDKSILSVLDETGGFTTRQVAQKVDPDGYRRNARIRAGTFRSFLMRLKKKNLVACLDEGKPVCWVRTSVGTAVYQEASNK
jgi:predicted transcriptional regulator